MTSAKQRQFAGQIAWERGLKITNWPTTTAGLSRLINEMLRPEVPIAAATEKQHDGIRERVERCIVEVEGFDPADYAELPENRRDASKMIRELDALLGKAEVAAVGNGLGAFVTAEGAVASGTDADPGDIPF